MTRHPCHFYSADQSDNTPTSTHTRGQSSGFQIGDALLEASIAVAAVRLGHADTREEQQAAWRELCSLHQQRSADQVIRMEIERGLRR
jgi:hypothetical protein